MRISLWTQSFCFQTNSDLNNTTLALCFYIYEHNVRGRIPLKNLFIFYVKQSKNWSSLKLFSDELCKVICRSVCDTYGLHHRAHINIQRLCVVIFENCWDFVFFCGKTQFHGLISLPKPSNCSLKSIIYATDAGRFHYML